MGKRGLGRAGSLGRGGRRGSARGRARTACRARAARALSASTCTRYSVCGCSQADVGRRGLGRSGGLGEGGAAAHVIANVLRFERERLAGAASASRPSLASVARRAPGGAASGHGRAGLAEQWSGGPRTTATCRAARQLSVDATTTWTAACVKRAVDLEFGLISGTAWGRTLSQREYVL